MKLDTVPEVMAYLGLPDPKPPAPLTPEEWGAAFADAPEAAPWTDDDVDGFADECGERPTPIPKTRKRRRRK